MVSFTDSDDEADRGTRRRLKRRCPISSSSDDSDDSDDYDYIRSKVANSTDSEDSGNQVVRKRINAKVIEAKWTPQKTVMIRYGGKGVKHACMNKAVHGLSKTSYHVLYLAKCPWKHNVVVMTPTPSMKTKLYQYCHKLCETCTADYGVTRCFKCDPENIDVTPLLDTIWGEEAIATPRDFVECVKRWQDRQTQARASFLVLHCTVIGKEAQVIRQYFGLKRNMRVQVVYSDVRERMSIAGSGVDLDRSEYKNTWKMVMKEKVKTTKAPVIALFGNGLFSKKDFRSLTMNDVLVMYIPTIISDTDGQALAALMNLLHTFTPSVDHRSQKARRGKVKAPGPACCLEDAKLHSQRIPASLGEQSLFDGGNIIASRVYKAVESNFGEKVSYEFQRQVGLGEELRIGPESDKVPFQNLYVSRGGDVRLQRGTRDTDPEPFDGGRQQRSNHRSSGNAGDTQLRQGLQESPNFEIICWTVHGSPDGSEFVIPGLMYKFSTVQGSTVIFRPSRFYYGTLPSEKRDMVNEKFAVALVS